MDHIDEGHCGDHTEGLECHTGHHIVFVLRELWIHEQERNASQTSNEEWDWKCNSDIKEPFSCWSKNHSNSLWNSFNSSVEEYIPSNVLDIVSHHIVVKWYSTEQINAD